jgi:methionyl-tRNA formyltransferase
MILTPPPVKVWAEKNNIPCLQPEDLHEAAFLEKLARVKAKLFVVVAYGKIIPKEVLGIPEKGSLNIHYSLLPKYRGASPIESAILNDDRHTGVSILLLDEKMDHGPIVAEVPVDVPYWPPTGLELRDWCNKAGAKLLAETIPLWVSGKITAHEQDHTKATRASKISKEDGLIDLAGDPYKNFLKIQAYAGWPGTYFFVERNGKKTRVLVKEAKFVDGKLEIVRVIPEGKKEMSYNEFSV